MAPSPTIKLQIILTSATAPSSRVRCSNLIPVLQQQQITSQQQVYPKSWRQRLMLLRQCLKADAVLVQKRLLSPVQFWLLRCVSRVLLFDFDDAIHLRQQNGRSEISKGRLHKFNRTIKGCDYIFAGNRILASMASPLNPRVEIIPSAVSVKDTPQKDYTRPVNKSVVIGWIGTEVNLPYLTLLAPTLLRLSETYNIELRIICSHAIEIPNLRVNFIPWQLETQEQEIAQFDIGLMPLPDSEHASGKCGYKALQYMAAAVPTVASDVGINSEIIRDKKEGILVKNIEGFYSALKFLIEEPSARQRIGLAGRARVEQDYSIEVVGKQLADAIKKAIKTHHEEKNR